jgi:hypothetical protein
MCNVTAAIVECAIVEGIGVKTLENLERCP